MGLWGDVGGDERQIISQTRVYPMDYLSFCHNCVPGQAFNSVVCLTKMQQMLAKPEDVGSGRREQAAPADDDSKPRLPC